MPRISIVHVYL